ncbi:MAG: class I SAM-dependent methyltransferase [Planctomycetes bacterium]|nr:class I SAM-dependent methyltransferase [Planctomycetota bacterium]
MSSGRCFFRRLVIESLLARWAVDLHFAWIRISKAGRSEGERLTVVDAAPTLILRRSALRQVGLQSSLNGCSVVQKQSYTTTGVPPWRVLVDGYHQLRSVRQQARRIGPHVTNLLRDLDGIAASISSLTGLTLRGLRALEIGHGQVQVLIGYMASLGNDVTGIDLETMPQGLLDVAGYWRLYRRNGAMRALKTAGRELSGINRALRREFCRQRAISAWPAYRQMAMDATCLEFDTGSFDLVYSTDVFEHLPDPQAALREVRRVLRPQGRRALWVIWAGAASPCLR